MASAHGEGPVDGLPSCLKVRTVAESLKTCKDGEKAATVDRKIGSMMKMMEALHLRRGHEDGHGKNGNVRPSSSCRVSFSTISWRQHETILGQSPGGISTIPTQTLGWGCTDLDTVDVEKYETERGPRRNLEAEMQERPKRGGGDDDGDGARRGIGSRTRHRVENSKKGLKYAELKAKGMSTIPEQRQKPFGVVSSLFKKPTKA